MKEINLYLILFIIIISSVLIFVFSDKIMKKNKNLELNKNEKILKEDSKIFN